MRRIAIINQKGGVGKTTTAANLSHALSMDGARVETIDMDPQGHLAAHFGFIDPSLKGLGELLLGEDFEPDWRIKARDNLTLLPSGPQLKRVELLPYQEETEERLKHYVSNLMEDCDYMIMDCPPASGVLILYALSVVDEIVVPVASDYLALRGLSDLMGTLHGYGREVDKSFSYSVVATRFHRRRNLCWEVRDKLLEYFPNQLLETHIRETSVLAECPSFGNTAFEYKKGNYGAEDYHNLAVDLIQGRYAS